MIEPWIGAPYHPRDWQFYALPKIIEQIKQGKKPIVSATMGSGKSVLIAELIWVALQKLKEDRCIIVAAPRQHLVEQLAETISIRVGEENVGRYYAHEKVLGAPIIVSCYPSLDNLWRNLDKDCSLFVGDEVHGTESEVFKRAFERLCPACAVGFTATPFRSNENETLSLWDSVAYRYTTEDALRDEVIVPWKLVHWSGENFKAKQVDEICCHLIKKYGEGPGIVNAFNIEDAEAFAEFLNKNGLNAAAIHSQLSKDEQEKRIWWLEHGGLDILVHVNLLSEGVNFPFLRWLCMRRPVSARVRFCQEVGRVLRADKGKKEAIIMDPFDLFGQHGLIYPEALGELLVEKVIDPDDEVLAKLDIEDEDAIEEFKNMRPAVAFNCVESWLKGIITAFRANGLAKPPNPDFEHLRGGKPTERQLGTLMRLKWATRYLPESHREDVKRLFAPERCSRLSQGAVSDMIDICISLAAQSREMRSIHRHWNFPYNVKLPETKIPIQGLLFISDR